MNGPNIFNSVSVRAPRRNVFDLSHDLKFSCDMGELVPVMVQECVPGDSFSIGCNALVRMAPMIAPIMHRLDVSVHYFFVPNRLVWKNWADFITDSDVAGTPIVHPFGKYGEATWSGLQLLDYLGLPPVNPASPTVVEFNPIALAAYNCIYSEYYRDQNLVPEFDYQLQDGEMPVAQLITLGQLRRRAWTHDYFTSALPFAQKGQPVQIPIATEGDAPVFMKTLSQRPQGSLQTWDAANSVSGTDQVVVTAQNTLENASQMFAQISGLASATSINDLRRAIRLQEWLELCARAGTRYTEVIRAHFGVRSSDARLQRPEYITGMKSPIIISEVLNTTGEDAGLPQGNMAGHGVGVATSRYGSFFCEEHGYIIGILSVMPQPAYQQGLAKHFSRRDKLDYYWPAFANIGEQEVLNKEIFVDSADPNGVFGYVPRYGEMKYTPSRVAGDFRGTLNYWHLGRIFPSLPALNQAFIECNPEKRIFAVQDPMIDSLYIQCLNIVKAVRPMPKFGTPLI